MESLEKADNGIVPYRKPYVAIAFLAVVGALFFILGLLLFDYRYVGSIRFAIIPGFIGGYLLVWAYNMATDDGKF